VTSTTFDRIDGLSAALAFKAPVRVATTANITLSGEQTIDGVAVVEDDRVLVKNQTTTTQNGVYTCETTAWTRAKDFDGARDAIKGTLVFVRSGTIHANSYWRLTTSSDPVVFGTDNITFEPAGQFWTSNVYAIGSVGGGTQDIDLNLANVFTMTITGATTFTVSNWPSSGTYREALLIITNGGSNVSWPSGTQFNNSNQPVLSTSGTDHLMIYSTDGGTTPYLVLIGMAFAT